MVSNLIVDNEKLVKKFGASLITEIKNLPNFYTFQKDLIYSHRDFDKFLKKLKKGETVRPESLLPVYLSGEEHWKK